MSTETCTGATCTDALQDYLERIGRIATLTAERERELARQFEVGVLAQERLSSDQAMTAEVRADLEYLMREGHDAYRTLMCGNLRLVVSIAKNYTGRGLALVDLIQNGNLGLDQAVKRFDYTRGLRFSTWAVWWIRQSIGQSLASEARAIRVPVHTLEAIHRLRQLSNALTADLGRTPHVGEVAAQAEVAPAEVDRLMAADRLPLSLDLSHPDGGELSPLRERLVDEESPSTVELVETRAMRTAVRNRVRALPPRERAVVFLRFGFNSRTPMTLERIGTILGVTKQGVRQIELRALRRLRTPELAAYLAGEPELSDRVSRKAAA